jgi:hypothetical protein
LKCEVKEVMVKKEDSETAASLSEELDELWDKQNLIRATYTKKIYSDQSFEQHGYHAAQKLRDAELTIQLNADEEYKKITKQIRHIRYELRKLGEATFGYFDDDEE